MLSLMLQRMWVSGLAMRRRMLVNGSAQCSESFSRFSKWPALWSRISLLPVLLYTLRISIYIQLLITYVLRRHLLFTQTNQCAGFFYHYGPEVVYIHRRR